MPPLPVYRAGAFRDINPRWSHDGTRIAFLRSTPDRKLQLFVVDADLERPLAMLEPELVTPDRPYAPDTRRYCSPDTVAWSPTDRYLAFERAEWFTFEDGDRIPGTGLWQFDTLTGMAKPLAVHPVHYVSYFYYYHTPTWSPDGKYLSFVGEGLNGQRRILVHPVHGQSSMSVSSRFDAYDDSDWPAWRPGPYGRCEIALRQGIRRGATAPPTETLRTFAPAQTATNTCTRLVRIPANGFAALDGTPLAAGEYVSPRIGHIAWSPDGTRVAYTLTPSAHDFDRYEIWITDAVGSSSRRVSPRNGRGYFAPVWIGDGRLGALSPNGDHFDVVTMAANGRQSVRVIGSIPTSDCDWSPDRSKIVYAGPPDYRMPNDDDPTGLEILSTRITAPSTGRR